MQLNITTDYAIRLLLSLGKMGVKKAGPLIAKEMMIPPKYILKISSKLRAAKLIGSDSGSQGGYYLMKPLEEITLMDVLSVMESTIKINRCLEPDTYCSRGRVKDCPVHRFYLVMQQELEEKWLSQSLSGIIEKYKSTWSNEIIGIEDARKEISIRHTCKEEQQEERLSMSEKGR